MNDAYEKAKKLIREGKLEEGAKLLRKNLGKDAEAELLNDLGVCLYLLAEPDPALELFSESLKKAPNFCLSRINRFYVEKAKELRSKADLNFRHIDHDALPASRPKPRISLIVRTYNRPDLLREALVSAKKQTFRDFETVVINDGGTKEAESVAKEINPPGLRYFLAAHRGPASALNRGLEMARGDYIGFLDDDDLIYPNHLEALLGRLEQEKVAGLAYPQVRINYYEPASRGGKLVRSEINIEESVDYEKCVRYDPIVSMLILASRECFETAGRFIEDLVTTAHDWEMWLRLLKHHRFYHLPEVTCEYQERIRQDRATRKGLFERYYYSNLMHYLHNAISLFSFPKKPENETAYRKALAEMDRLSGKYDGLENKIRLRGFYDFKSPYGYFYDRYLVLKDFGETELAKDFLRAALKLSPFEPKLWGSLMASALAGKGEQGDELAAEKRRAPGRD